jgi:hypothetical protein
LALRVILRQRSISAAQDANIILGPNVPMTLPAPTR